MKTRIIQANGTEIEIAPTNGTDFSLAEMQKVVGGFVEVHDIGWDARGDPWVLVLNEDGRRLDLPANAGASALWAFLYGPEDLLRGDALVCRKDQIK